MVNIPEYRLFLKKDKKNKKNGKIPLHIGFRIDGKEIRFSLGKKGNPLKFLEEEWDNKNKCPYNPSLRIIVSEEVNRINSTMIDAVRHKEEITKDLLQRIVRDEDSDGSKDASFLDYFKKYIEFQERNNAMSSGTFKTYMTTFRALESFRKEIKIRDINAKLINDFDKFLIKRGKESEKGDVKGSRYNRLKHVRAVINYIENRQRIEIKNPFRSGDVVIPKLEANGAFLNFEELEKMYKLIQKIEIGTPEYRVLIMYLFSCVSGFRISDAVEIKWRNIDFEHNTFVKEAVKNRARKKKILTVPVFELAGKILELATENEINNVEPENNIFLEVKGDLNEILRKLAEQIGIEKYLTYHSSRRTFATLAILQGVDIQTLKEYMGHESFRTTEMHYKGWDSSLAAHTAKILPLFEIEKVIKKKKVKKRK